LDDDADLVLIWLGTPACGGCALEHNDGSASEPENASIMKEGRPVEGGLRIVTP